MLIDTPLARALSQKHMEQWVAEGLAYSQGLQRVVANASKYLQRGSSPSKAVHKTLGELKVFFQYMPVEGSISEIHGRKFNFSLKFPELTQDGLCFSVVAGSVNGRNGNIEVKEKKPLAMTVHALERLHQRIDTTNSKEILKEIYSTLGHCEVFLDAGRQVKATCWPLLSQRGFFVAAPSLDSSMGILVTWMDFEQLSRKWGMVAESLREIAQHKPQLLTDVGFCVEFLRSFPWMLKPHRPDVDIGSLAWQQSPPDGQLPHMQPSQVQCASAVSPHAKESQQDLKSIDFIPGLNYFSSPPPFNMHSRFEGIVVQVQRSGYCIVGLQNGWVGSIPPIAIDRANNLKQGMGDLSIGDKVPVEVRKIGATLDGSAYSLLLDLAEKVDAEWAIFEHRYPKDTIASGLIFNVKEYCCYLRFADGAVAQLMKNQFFWPGNVDFDENALAVGQTLTVKIIGNIQSRRILTASLRQLSEKPKKLEPVSADAWLEAQALHPDGAIVTGKIDKFYPSGAKIVLTDGSIGFLSIKELSWSGGATSVDLERLCDQWLTLKVIGFYQVKRSLNLSYRQCITHPMDEPALRPVVGVSYEGVVTAVQDYGFFIRLPTGLEGLLHKKALPGDLGFKAGDLVCVVVVSVDTQTRRISLGLFQANKN